MSVPANKQPKILRKLIWITACGFLIAIDLGATACYGESASVDDSREAMRYSTDASWYDYDSDRLVFPDSGVLSEPGKKVANRHDKVVNKIQTTPTNYWDSWTFFGDCFEGMLEAWGTLIDIPWIRELLFLVMCILVGGLVFFALRRFNPEGFRMIHKAKSSKLDNTDRDQMRIVDLPFPIHDLKTDLWSEVLRLRDQGDYSRAVVYLYGHVLVELDAAGCIRLQRGKTNGIYVRELNGVASLQQPHRELVKCFEAVFFGRHSLSSIQFDDCVNDVAKMKQTLATITSKKKQNDLIESQKNLSITGPVNELIGKTVSLVLILCFLLVIGFGSGCDTNRPDSDILYGEASALGAKRSVAGLTAFRALCEKKGLTSVQLDGLSLRSRQLDAIVFIPKSIRTPTTAEITWFESWLSENPNRVLVFVGRDFSPSVRYWQAAMKTDEAIDRVVFAQEKGLAETAHDAMRYENRIAQDCKWFRYVPNDSELLEKQLQKPETFQGAWVAESDQVDLDVPLRGHLEPKDLYTSAARKRRRESNERRVDRLIETADSRPIAFSIHSSDWSGGAVYVLANGAMILNEGLSNPSHRAIAKKLISVLPTNGRIGFLSPRGETVIRSDTDKQDASGFELLRVWPLSLIAMQGLLVGFVVLLALFPIFGRPRKIATESTADFGLHIHALGQLLHQTNDKNYALQKIASYFRDVKREPNNSWAQVAQPSKEFPNDRIIK
ncbi:MAG: DUF4129 domain-containing protein [Planctomycetota bacterium]|nr:DUF4129 domain-containing protein [Planctomycetota bacterium]